MDIPELPRRIHTVGKESSAWHSISYHTCWTLHDALKEALHDDEYEELKESKLGVFIKFQDLGFEWASRLVHYMLGFQLDIKKKYELWSLVGPEPVRFSLPQCVVTKELTSFWGMLGVHVEAGPYTEEIIAAFGRCEGWSRDDCKRLAYLAIFTGYIEGRKYSTPTRVSLARLVMELERFENYPWGRVAFKVLMDSVKGKDISALPELGANYGNPLPNNPSPPILAYKGNKGCRRFKEAILSHTRVINFVEKDIGEMFPKWEFDVEDTPAENIIKLMFVKKPWKWTMEHWEVTGIRVNTKTAVVSPAKKKVVKEDSPRPWKKARKEAPAEASEEAHAESSEQVHTVARSEVTTTVGGLTNEDIKTMLKDVVDAMREGFGTCLKEIKYLSEMVEAMEKKVDTSSSKDKAPEPSLVLLDKNQSTVSDLQKEDARYQDKRDAALALCSAKSDQTRRLADSQQSPYTANITAKVIIPNKKLYPGYNPFAPIDKKKLNELSDWLKTCPHYRTALDKKPRTSRTWWYHILRTSLEWLEDCHIDAWINVLRKRYDANPQHFRSERMCFLDHLFAQQWRFNFKDFKDSEPNQNGLGRKLPGGAWNYYAGTIPSFWQSNKVLGTDIDDIYAPVNYSNTHWIAMWISIPKRNIVVFDSICSSISPEELDVVMEPFLYMVPYLLVECSSSDEQRAQYSLEPFTYEGLDNILPARAGDCGVYTLNKKDFAKVNGKSTRDKMAVDIFQEHAHEFLNKDNDANLGAYEA
ncbi:hypothetical protein BRARA_I02401 [Brassica rapa]|uniref:Ubiquitin-like protease family profile domain-containing protein n=1 Tax=Brassica campestris TaxID=3711 RepID=A0A397Y514_BRACM|nr:hypothetical protein BRARA_I02401 [Brassica rapa]